MSDAEPKYIIEKRKRRQEYSKKLKNEAVIKAQKALSQKKLDVLAQKIVDASTTKAHNTKVVSEIYQNTIEKNPNLTQDALFRILSQNYGIKEKDVPFRPKDLLPKPKSTGLSYAEINAKYDAEILKARNVGRDEGQQKLEDREAELNAQRENELNELREEFLPAKLALEKQEIIKSLTDNIKNSPLLQSKPQLIKAIKLENKDAPTTNKNKEALKTLLVELLYIRGIEIQRERGKGIKFDDRLTKYDLHPNHLTFDPKSQSYDVSASGLDILKSMSKGDREDAITDAISKKTKGGNFWNDLSRKYGGDDEKFGSGLNRQVGYHEDYSPKDYIYD
tara:strand:+ start:50 stop:1054 length:1005 start_codon:yes stop_codon:yes gene_type:complete